MEELLKNIFFIFLLGILAIINYEAFDKKQKIAIIYTCGFGLTFNKNIKTATVFIMLIFILFLYEEYLNKDLIKIKFTTKIIHKCADFLYMYIFQYKIIYILAAIILKTNIKVAAVSGMAHASGMTPAALENIIVILSSFIFIIGIHRIFSNPVELKSFKQINEKFGEYPYYSFKEIREREALFTKLELVADIEDYTFFMRSKSYSSCSLEFIHAVLKRKRQGGHAKTRENKCIDLWRRLVCFMPFKRFIKALKSKNKISSAKKYITMCYKRFFTRILHAYPKFRRKCVQKIKRYLRGYSTIEMQLIRILSYKKGLKMGIPHNFEEIYLVFTRKLYEIIYAPVFFTGLKKNLNISSSHDYFRYYLVYIYLHTVQTKLNENTFRPTDKIFGEVDVVDWPAEVLFVITLGLNGMQITPRRIGFYQHIINKYNLDIKRICELVECIS